MSQLSTTSKRRAAYMPVSVLVAVLLLLGAGVATAAPETLDPSLVDVSNSANKGLFPIFAGFSASDAGSTDGLQSPPANTKPERVFDGDPTTCMNWNSGGTYFVGVYYGANSEMFIDLGREAVVESVKVLLDPTATATQRKATMAMIRVFFSTISASTGSASCGKDVGFSWYGGTNAHVNFNEQNICASLCDCSGCPSAENSWPPGSSSQTVTMTQPKTTRYIIVNYDGINGKADGSLFNPRDPEICGIKVGDWYVSTCHVEILVKVCDAGYWYDTVSGKCKLCALGYYCPGGYAYDDDTSKELACPAMVFGDARGLSTAACNGACGDGYDCAAGTITSKVTARCDSIDSYCIGGRRFSIVDGFEAGFSNGLAVRADRCPAGTWCKNGVKADVTAGYFSSVGGSAQQFGEGQCRAGFRCPAGSSSETSNPCADPLTFCVAGTGATGVDVTTSPAHYTESERIGGITVYYSQKLCQAGFYCTGGVRFSCAAGVQATSTGQSTPQCDGPCPAGYQCGARGAQQPCGAGYYCTDGRELEPALPINGRQACPRGRFTITSTAQSFADCLQCPVGTASSTLAATSAAECIQCPTASTAVPGSVECSPVLLSVVAVDDGADKTPGLSNEDVITFTFDKATDERTVDTDARVNDVVTFDPPLPASLRGSWTSPTELRIVLFNVAETVDRVATRIGALRATIRPFRIKSASGDSSAFDPGGKFFVVTGSWGESSQPDVFTMAALPALPGQRLVRATPDSANMQAADWLGIPLAGDRIVVAFDQPVRRVPAITAAEIDSLLLWNMRPAVNYTGMWNSRNTALTITIVEPYALSQLSLDLSARLQIGELAMRVNASAGLTSADEASLPCNASAALRGVWTLSPQAARVVQHSSSSLMVRWSQAPISASAISATKLAEAGTTQTLTVSHTLVRWCDANSSQTHCDEVAVATASSAIDDDGGNNGTALPLALTTMALLPSTNHLEIAPGAAVRVWVAAVTSDGRVWPMVPAADGTAGLHTAEAASSSVCAASPHSKALFGAQAADPLAAASAAGFQAKLNLEPGCVCAYERAAHFGSAASAPGLSSVVQSAQPALELTSDPVARLAASRARFPLLGQRCNPTVAAIGGEDPLMSDAFACRCRVASSAALNFTAAEAEWLSPINSRAASSCPAPLLTVTAPRIAGIDGPDELATVGREAVWLHGAGLGLIPEGFTVQTHHAAALSSQWQIQRAAAISVRSAAASSPDGALALALTPAPPATAPRLLLQGLAQSRAAPDDVSSVVGAAILNNRGFVHNLTACSITCSQLVVRCETTSGIGRNYRPRVRFGTTWGTIDETEIARRASPGRSGQEHVRLVLSDSTTSDPPSMVDPAVHGICGIVAVDGLRSCLRYGPPVIASFTGNGSTAALTRGGQGVIVQGRQFGTQADIGADTSFKVTYSPVGSASRVYEATACSLVTEHDALECSTTEGAGDQLTWSIIIGYQRSVVPRTAYAPPVISSLRLYDSAAEAPLWTFPSPLPPGIPKATIDSFNPRSDGTLSTAGRDWLVIEGADFGPNMSFVSRVSLASTGTVDFAPLEQVLFAWTGEVITGADDSESGGTEAPIGGGSTSQGLTPSPEQCWMITPHSRIMCYTTSGSGVGWRAEVAVMAQQSPASATSLRYAPPIVELSSVSSIPTEGDPAVLFRMRNAPPDASYVSITVLSQEVREFTLIPLLQDRSTADVSLNILPLTGSAGSQSSVVVRFSVQGQTTETELAVRMPSISRLDVDNIVNRSALLERPPLPGAAAQSQTAALLEVYGTSLGTDRSVFDVKVGPETCQVLDDDDIRRYVDFQHWSTALDTHRTLLCFTTQRAGLVRISGSASYVGAGSGPIDLTSPYSYNQLKRAPSPRVVSIVGGGDPTRIRPMGRDVLQITGQDIFSAGELAVELLLLDTTVAGIQSEQREILASIPCLVMTRGRSADRAVELGGVAGGPLDACVLSGAFGTAPTTQGERDQPCADVESVVCESMTGRGQNLFVRVIHNSLGGISAGPLVGYAGPTVSQLTPPTAPTRGGINITITVRDGGSQRLPQGMSIVKPSHAFVAALSTVGSVSIGGQPCIVQTWADTSIVCLVPPGISSAPEVIVSRDLSAVAEMGNFSYEAPAISPISVTTWPFAPELLDTSTDAGNRTKARLLAAIDTLDRRDRIVAAGGQASLDAFPDSFKRDVLLAEEALRNGDSPDAALFAPTTRGGILLTVHGSNLGSNPRVELTRSIIDLAGSLQIIAIPCVAVPASSSHDQAVCLLGEGSGSGINVTVFTGDRSTRAPWWMHFQRPSISAMQADTLRLSPADMTTPVTSVTSGRKLTSETDSGFRPALGGFLLHMQGTSFSSAPVITVGGLPCRVVFAETLPGAPSGVGRVYASAAVPGAGGTPPATSTLVPIELLPQAAQIEARWVWSHESIVCVAPPGVGRGVAVIVSATGLDSDVETLEYDAPVVQLSVPGFARAPSSADAATSLGPASITIQGQSFGPAITTSGTTAVFALSETASASAQLLFPPVPPSFTGQTLPNGALGFLNGDPIGTGSAIVDILFASWRETAPASAVTTATDVTGMAETLVFSRLCSTTLMSAQDSALQCTVSAGSTVDVGLVTVRVADKAAEPRGMLLLCPAGWYGAIGEACAPCPVGAVCPGGFIEPLPTRGFFKRGRRGFAQCVPADACSGFGEGGQQFAFDQLQLGSGTQQLALAQTALARRFLQDTTTVTAQPDGQDSDTLAAVQAAWAGAEEAIGSLFPPGGPVSEAWSTAKTLNERALQAQCAEGYTGDRCSQCSAERGQRRYYRLEELCAPCPDLGWLYLIIGGVAIVCLAGLAYLLHRSQVNLSGASVGVDFLQSIALFATLGFRWPVELRIVWNVVSSTNLNLQLLAPSCAIEWSPEIQFYLIVALPLAVVVLALMAAAIVKIVQFFWRYTKRALGLKANQLESQSTADTSSSATTDAAKPASAGGRRRGGVVIQQQQVPRRSSKAAELATKSALANVEQESAFESRVRRAAEAKAKRQARAEASSAIVDAILGGAFSILYFAYLSVSRTSIQWFDCFEVVQPDGTPGELVLDADPSIECDTVNSAIYGRVMPLAALSTAVYGAGVPIAFSCILYAYRKEISADQILRERGEGNSPKTNPNFAVRKRFGRVYGDFKANFTGWRVVLLLRKLALVAVALLFSRQPMFAGTVSVLILFMSYAAHTKYLPFLSTAALSKDFLKLADEDGVEAQDLLQRGKAKPSSKGGIGGKKGADAARSLRRGAAGARSISASRAGSSSAALLSRSASMGRLGAASGGGTALGQSFEMGSSTNSGLGGMKAAAREQQQKEEQDGSDGSAAGICFRMARCLCPFVVICVSDAKAKRRLRMRRAVRNARVKRKSMAAGANPDAGRRLTAVFNDLRGRGLLSEKDSRGDKGGSCLRKVCRCVCCCYYCCCKRSPPLDIDKLSPDELLELKELAVESSLGYSFDYNSLESSYLSSSITILVGGMVFTSVELVHGSVEYIVLTSLLAVLIVSAALSTFWLLFIEVYKSVRFARVFAIARQHEEKIRSAGTDMQRRIRGIDVVFKKAEKDTGKVVEVSKLLASSAASAAAARHDAKAAPSSTAPGRLPASRLAKRLQAAASKALAQGTSAKDSSGNPRMSSVAALALQQLRTQTAANEAGVLAGKAAQHNPVAFLVRASSESGHASPLAAFGSIHHDDHGADDDQGGSDRGLGASGSAHLSRRDILTRSLIRKRVKRTKSALRTTNLLSGASSVEASLVRSDSDSTASGGSPRDTMITKSEGFPSQIGGMPSSRAATVTLPDSLHRDSKLSPLNPARAGKSALNLQAPHLPTTVTMSPDLHSAAAIDTFAEDGDCDAEPQAAATTHAADGTDNDTEPKAAATSHAADGTDHDTAPADTKP